MSDNEQVIAAYATGSAGFAKVDKAMDQAWAEILADQVAEARCKNIGSAGSKDSEEIAIPPARTTLA